MDANPMPRVPASFWVVAGLGAVWNSFGAYDYLMTRLRNLDYLAAATGSADGARQMLDLIDGMPLWAQVLWGTGVWFSVLGSVLMLVRSRHAASAFLVSLVAAAASMIYQSTLTMPPALATPAAKIMPAVILGLIILLWLFCRRMAARGVLR